MLERKLWLIHLEFLLIAQGPDAMDSPTASQGTQDAAAPEEAAVERASLQLLFCTKQQAAALLAVQQGVQGRLWAPAGLGLPLPAAGAGSLVPTALIDCRAP